LFDIRTEPAEQAALRELCEELEDEFGITDRKVAQFVMRKMAEAFAAGYRSSED
jgi:hypothetical protein